jgi:hypothetical protein
MWRISIRVAEHGFDAFDLRQFGLRRREKECVVRRQRANGL